VLTFRTDAGLERMSLPPVACAAFRPGDKVLLRGVRRGDHFRPAEVLILIPKPRPAPEAPDA
jgi:hypothetical protein